MHEVDAPQMRVGIPVLVAADPPVDRPNISASDVDCAAAGPPRDIAGPGITGVQRLTHRVGVVITAPHAVDRDRAVPPTALAETLRALGRPPGSRALVASASCTTVRAERNRAGFAVRDCLGRRTSVQTAVGCVGDIDRLGVVAQCSVSIRVGESSWNLPIRARCERERERENASERNPIERCAHGMTIPPDVARRGLEGASGTAGRTGIFAMRASHHTRHRRGPTRCARAQSEARATRCYVSTVGARLDRVAGAPVGRIARAFGGRRLAIGTRRRGDAGAIERARAVDALLAAEEAAHQGGALAPRSVRRTRGGVGGAAVRAAAIAHLCDADTIVDVGSTVGRSDVGRVAVAFDLESSRAPNARSAGRRIATGTGGHAETSRCIATQSVLRAVHREDRPTVGRQNARGVARHQNRSVARDAVVSRTVGRVVAERCAAERRRAVGRVVRAACESTNHVGWQDEHRREPRRDRPLQLVGTRRRASDWRVLQAGPLHDARTTDVVERHRAWRAPAHGRAQLVCRTPRVALGHADTGDAGCAHGTRGRASRHVHRGIESSVAAAQIASAIRGTHGSDEQRRPRYATRHGCIVAAARFDGAHARELTASRSPGRAGPTSRNEVRLGPPRNNERRR